MDFSKPLWRFYFLFLLFQTADSKSVQLLGSRLTFLCETLMNAKVFAMRILVIKSNRCDTKYYLTCRQPQTNCTQSDQRRKQVEAGVSILIIPYDVLHVPTWFSEKFGHLTFKLCFQQTFFDFHRLKPELTSWALSCHGVSVHTVPSLSRCLCSG